MTAITLDLRPLIDLSDEQFYQLCQANPDIRLGTDRQRGLIVPPTGGKHGNRNFSLIFLELGLKKPRAWRRFDSSTEFNLPSGGDRSPRCCLGEDGTHSL